MASSSATGVELCVDFHFLEGFFVGEVPEKYSCPICLSPVQRDAFLTQCCGNHFCVQCISRMVNSRKPCPMCKTSPLLIFPNKERQREVNSLRVRCPAQLKNDGKGYHAHKLHPFVTFPPPPIPNCSMGCSSLL